MSLLLALTGAGGGPVVWNVSAGAGGNASASPQVLLAALANSTAVGAGNAAHGVVSQLVGAGTGVGAATESATYVLPLAIAEVAAGDSQHDTTFQYTPATTQGTAAGHSDVVLSAYAISHAEAYTAKNFVTNSAGIGGVAGTPGTAPTGWDWTNPAYSRTIVGFGVDPATGLDYVDVRYQGAVNGGLITINPHTTVALTQPYPKITASMYLGLVAGAWPSPASIIFGFSSSAGADGQPVLDVSGITTSALTRVQVSRSYPTYQFAPGAGLDFYITPGVNGIDVTLRIAGYQLEEGVMTASPFIRTTNGALFATPQATSTSMLVQQGVEAATATVAHPGTAAFASAGSEPATAADEASYPNTGTTYDDSDTAVGTGTDTPTTTLSTSAADTGVATGAAEQAAQADFVSAQTDAGAATSEHPAGAQLVTDHAAAGASTEAGSTTASLSSDQTDTATSGSDHDAAASTDAADIAAATSTDDPAAQAEFVSASTEASAAAAAHPATADLQAEDSAAGTATGLQDGQAGTDAASDELVTSDAAQDSLAEMSVAHEEMLIGLNNYCSNSEFVGVTTGNLPSVSGGEFTFRSTTPTTSFCDIVATGTEFGDPYIDVRFYGTHTANSSRSNFVLSGVTLGGATRTVMTSSATITLVGGELPLFDYSLAGKTFGLKLAIGVGVAADGVNLFNATTSPTIPLSDLQLGARLNVANTYRHVDGTSYPYAKLALLLTNLVALEPFDFTIRISRPQFNYGENVGYSPTNGPASQVAYRRPITDNTVVGLSFPHDELTDSTDAIEGTWETAADEQEPATSDAAQDSLTTSVSADQTDTATPVEDQTATQDMTSELAEAGTGAEAQDAAAQFIAAEDEAGAGTDAADTALLATADQTDTTTPDTAQDALAGLGADRTEPTTADAAHPATAEFVSETNEPAPATELVSASGNFVATLTEAGALLAAQDFTTDTNADQTDTGAPDAAQTVTQGTGNDATEPGAATDAPASTAQFVSADTAAAPATDAPASTYITSTADTEAGAAGATHDSLSGVLVAQQETVQRTNLMPNSTMQGAVVGIVGSGGALPTGWEMGLPAGLTRQVVEIGVDANEEYIDIRLFGTNAQAVTVYPDLYVYRHVPVVQGEVITASGRHTYIAGSRTGFVNPNVTITIGEWSAANAYLGEFSASAANGARTSVTKTMTNAAVAKAGLFYSRAVAANATVDYTFRVSIPQIERGTVATPFIPTSGTTVTVNATGTQTAGAAQPVAETEAGTASDTPAGTAAFPAANADAGAATDAPASTYTTASTQTDAGTAGTAQDGIAGTMVDGSAEGTANAAHPALAAFVAAEDETLTAADVLAGTATMGNAITNPATATDASTAGWVTVAAVTHVGSATTAQDFLAATPADHTATGTADDAASTQFAQAADAQATTFALDTAAGAAMFIVTGDETAAAAAAQDSLGAITAHVDEVTSLLESLFAQLIGANHVDKNVSYALRQVAEAFIARGETAVVRVLLERGAVAAVRGETKQVSVLREDGAGWILRTTDTTNIL